MSDVGLVAISAIDCLSSLILMLYSNYCQLVLQISELSMGCWVVDPELTLR